MICASTILADEEELTNSQEESVELFNITENNFEVVEGEEVHLKEYIELASENNVRIISFADEADHLDPGEHSIAVLGVDEYGNSQTEILNFNVISEEEWNAYVRSITRFASRKAGLNNNLRDEKGHADKDAIELAKSFIGMQGSCDKVAQAFITAYFGRGYSMYDTYQVSIDEIKPGDVISVREIKKDSAIIKENVEANSARPVPAWLEKDAENLTGKVVRLATREDVDLAVEEHLIVELYSK